MIERPHFSRAKRATPQGRQSTSLSRKNFPKLGPTGNYPQGKLDPTDEGELIFTISVCADFVRMDFQKKLEWLAMTPNQARVMASLLKQKADAIDGGGKLE